MKKLRTALVPFVIGLVISIPTIVVLAQCAETIVHNGKVCTLVGQNCSGNVCVCAYNCGPKPVNESE